MTPQREAEMSKSALRRAMLLELQALGSDERLRLSETICARVAESPMWREALRVLLFSPFPTEPQITPLHTAAVAGGKTAFVIPPTLRNEAELELSFVPDLVLVPGLAFSRENHRLGRGGGFYDRLLTGRAADACKLAVCFRFQVRDQIPHEVHDVKMDVVITD